MFSAVVGVGDVAPNGLAQRPDDRTKSFDESRGNLQLENTRNIRIRNNSIGEGAALVERSENTHLR